MASAPPREVTRLLHDWSHGDRAALDALIPLVHAELHRLARGFLARERPGHTLQPTALVNEAYLRLVGERAMEWQSRAHFLGVAAQLMRFILVDHCRRKNYQKRGGATQHLPLDDAVDASHERGAALVALDDALARLQQIDPRKSKIAELKYFGGLSAEEIGQSLCVSEKTILREWRLAKAWLQHELAS
jgi:RNA polymerase sigma factor (TIGR02999 family)